MKLSEQTLTHAQMEHLRELGLDTSDAGLVLIYKDDEGNECSWNEVKFTPKNEPYIEDYGDIYDVYPEYFDAENGNYDQSYREESVVYTLQEVLEKLPKAFEYIGVTYKYNLNLEDDIYEIGYTSLDCTRYFEAFLGVSLLSAGYKALCWLLENKLYKEDTK